MDKCSTQGNGLVDFMALVLADAKVSNSITMTQKALTYFKKNSHTTRSQDIFTTFCREEQERQLQRDEQQARLEKVKSEKLRLAELRAHRAALAEEERLAAIERRRDA
eukprot:GSA25T00026764001.1